MTAITIKPLAACPQHIDQLADALHAQWHDFAPWANRQKIVARYQDALAGGQLFPQVWMAEDAQGRLLGSASVKEYDLAYHEAARYRLGDVFVLPEHRGCGAGKALVHTAIDFARTQGVQQLYLYTPDMQNLSERYGWRRIDERWVNGETVSIMLMDIV